MHHEILDFQVVKPKWEWLKVDPEHYFYEEGHHRTQNFQSKFNFELKQPNGSLNVLKLIVNIDTQKSPMYKQNIGWNWHKSCMFPTIVIRAELYDDLNEQTHQLPINIEVLLSIVKLKNTKEQSLNDLIIKSVKHEEPYKTVLTNGVAIIESINFKTTSYLNQGSKFNFLITLRLPKSESEQEQGILCSFISPSVFVDSRKFATQYQVKKLRSYVTPFNPSILNQVFYKNESTPSGLVEAKVQNSLQGLYHYLTATNIRNKVKHPLYLCMKFSNALQIMYNPKNSKFQQSNKNIVQILQSALESQMNHKQKLRKIKKGEQKLFQINVKGESKNDQILKIFENLEMLNCGLIEVNKWSSRRKCWQHNIMDQVDILQSWKQYYQRLTEPHESKCQNEKQLQSNLQIKSHQQKRPSKQKSSRKRTKHQLISLCQELEMQPLNTYKKQIEYKKIQSGYQNVQNWHKKMNIISEEQAFNVINFNYQNMTDIYSLTNGYPLFYFYQNQNSSNFLPSLQSEALYYKDLLSNMLDQQTRSIIQKLALRNISKLPWNHSFCTFSDNSIQQQMLLSNILQNNLNLRSLLNNL